MDSSTTEEKTYQGIGASPGIVHGKIFLLNQKELYVPEYNVPDELMEAEIKRFEDALIVTRQQIQKIQEEIRQALGEDEARIFDAHLLLLEDKALIDESIREMRDTDENIEKAVWTVGHRYIDELSRIDDDYLRERAIDLRDVLRRILSNLTGQKLNQFGGMSEGHVLVSKDITPSESASVDKTKLLGIVTDAGSKTSHAVIVARSMNIPAVVGLGDISDKVNHNDIVLVDGYDGCVIVNPSENTLFKYGKLKSERRSIEERMIALSQEGSQTIDGHDVLLMANIESPDETQKAVEMGAGGIGLFRTEYLFMNSQKMPSEEEQFEAYRKVVEVMDGRPVVIRTLDLGGDKLLTAGDAQLNKESNPFLGYRAVRYCLDHEHLFKAQLRAILRASAFGDVRMMYPMISGVTEMRMSNHLLEDSKEELRNEGVAFDEKLSAGTMIEIPSAAIACDTLLGEAAFFSIGTNDLIQYLIAVDRLNDRVAHLYEPTHPAVIRTLSTIIETAKKGKIPVSICGEVAGDPVMVPLFVGMGVQVLSMSSSLLPNVRYVVQNMKMKDARKLAKMALAEPDGTRVLENLLEFYTERMADLY